MFGPSIFTFFVAIKLSIYFEISDEYFLWMCLLAELLVLFFIILTVVAILILHAFLLHILAKLDEYGFFSPKYLDIAEFFLIKSIPSYHLPFWEWGWWDDFIYDPSVRPILEKILYHEWVPVYIRKVVFKFPD